MQRCFLWQEGSAAWPPNVLLGHGQLRPCWGRNADEDCTCTGQREAGRRRLFRQRQQARVAQLQ